MGESKSEYARAVGALENALTQAQFEAARPVLTVLYALALRKNPALLEALHDFGDAAGVDFDMVDDLYQRTRRTGAGPGAQARPARED